MPRSLQQNTGLTRRATGYQLQFRWKSKVRYIGVFPCRKAASDGYAAAISFLTNPAIDPSAITALLPPKAIARLINLREAA